jgi:hypothetical protein
MSGNNHELAIDNEFIDRVNRQGGVVMPGKKENYLSFGEHCCYLSVLLLNKLLERLSRLKQRRDE